MAVAIATSPGFSTAVCEGVPQIAKLEIGGTFPSDDVKLFGRAAHIALGLRVEERNNNIVISQ